LDWSIVNLFHDGYFVLSTIIAAITLGIMLYTKLFKPLFLYVQEDKVLHQKLEVIMRELFPNGGGSFRDAIDRIEIRQLLSEQRQRVFFQDLNLSICETNAAGECIWVNRTFARLTGRLPSELLKFNWVNAIVPEDRDRVLKEWMAAVEQGREFVAHYKVLHSTGTDIPVYARTFPLYGIEKSVGGKFTNIIGHIGLITIDDPHPENYAKFFGKERYDLATVGMPRLDI